MTAITGVSQLPPRLIPINGINYVALGAPETLTVSFLMSDAAVTRTNYSGFVELIVSGSGESRFTQLNDAFYVYTDAAHNAIVPFNDTDFWQLALDSAPLTSPTQPICDAKRHIVFDLDAGHQVNPPYTCAYRLDHVYDFVINADQLASGGRSNPIRFGVCDQIFSDNAGAYTILVQQLGVMVPEAPRILTPPQSQTAEIGNTVCERVHATGLPHPTFLWFFNATNCLGVGTNCFFQLTNAKPQDCGDYSVVATNVAGAVTSAPARLSVIVTVERRSIVAIEPSGEAGTSLHLEYTDTLHSRPNWLLLDTLPLVSPPQWYFDLSTPLPPQRYYRVWQSGTPSILPALTLPGIVPALTLSGMIGDKVRVDAINQFGPTDAWFTLATVTLTNTTQLYFDVSSIGRPPRLYRLVPVP
jgi:hypothetical protein